MTPDLAKEFSRVIKYNATIERVFFEAECHYVTSHTTLDGFKYNNANRKTDS